MAPKASRARRLSLGAAPLLALVTAGGLVMIALGNNAARESDGGGELAFWAGLAVIYGPIAFRLLSARASRAERVALVVLLGVSLFAVRVLASPTAFVRYDELGTWRATNDLLQTGHLFSANPLVVSTAGFPGIEAVTAAVAQLAGLSIFHAGLVVLGVARVAMVVLLFLFLERVTRSARAAGIGVAVYACNPSFLYFDSQFAYESLALMIAAALLVVAVRWSEPDQPRRPTAVVGLVGAMAVLAATLTMTHHMTSYALLTFLAAWAVLVALAGRKKPARGSNRPGGPAADGTPGSVVAANGGGTVAARRVSFLHGPGLPAALMGGMAIAWFACVAGGVTIDELGKVVTGAIDSTLRLVFGGSGPKTLFAGGGQSNTLAARALAIGSVIPLLVLILLGLRRTWRARDSSALWRTLALAAMLYPVSLGLRLTQAGSETSQRASAFVFIGVAFFAGLVLSELSWPKRAARSAAKALGLTAVALVVFLGGFIVGELPATRQPGPFLVGAEDRSTSPQGLAAARFAASELPPGSRIIVDRPNGTLLASYGGLTPVVGRIEGTPVTRVFFSERFDRADRQVIKDDLIDYIVVDRRLSRALPVLGYYFDPEERGAFARRKPISAASLAKFRRARGLSKVFVDGPITIYSTAGLRSR